MNNINDITLGQIKQLQGLLSNRAKSESTLFDDVIGKYAIVRTCNEGINAGFVERADETGIILKDARRIWHHRPADTNLSWYEGVAQTGLADSSKISCAVERKVIVEDYSITICSDEAAKNIQEFKSHGQN